MDSIGNNSSQSRIAPPLPERHPCDAVILVDRHQDVGAAGHLFQDPFGQALVEHQEALDLLVVHDLGAAMSMTG